MERLRKMPRAASGSRIPQLAEACRNACSSEHIPRAHLLTQSNCHKNDAVSKLRNALYPQDQFRRVVSRSQIATPSVSTSTWTGMRFPTPTEPLASTFSSREHTGGICRIQEAGDKSRQRPDIPDRKLTRVCILTMIALQGPPVHSILTRRSCCSWLAQFAPGNLRQCMSGVVRHRSVEPDE